MNFIRGACWAIYSLFLHVTDSAALLFVRGKPRESDPRKKILIVRMDAIGDFILYLDAAKGIRERFPRERYEVTLFGNRVWTSLAERVGLFDVVLPVNCRKFIWSPPYRWRTLRKIAGRHFDIVIHPTYSREFLYGDAVVRASGAGERIGSVGDCSNIRPWEKRISNRWYTHLVLAAEEPLMELTRNAEFLRRLGLPAFRCGVPELPGFSPPPSASGLPYYYVLFPGAGLPIKHWPVEHFAALAGRIYKATGWTGIVCGGPGEEEIGNTLLRSTSAPLQNRSGRTTLQELVSIISGARLVVSNDTSAIHIAAAVSTPAVCILGGGHYGRFVPYRIETPTEKPLPVPVVYTMDCYYCNWDCIYNPKKDEPAPCVKNISVDAVWQAVRQTLPRIAVAPTKKDGRAAE